MPEISKKVFDGFVKPIPRLVEAKGFKNPIGTQEKDISKILEEKKISSYLLHLLERLNRAFYPF